MDTVYLLVDNESSFVIIPPANSKEFNIPDATAVHIVQLIMPAFYLGCYERVIYLAKKFESLHEQDKARMPMRIILVSFYHGLAMAEAYRRKKGRNRLRILNLMISVLKKASGLSSWNFKNKLLLLEAEKLSIVGNETNKPNYDLAIKSSQSSKFIHDEALACELAGKHFERTKNFKEAIKLYKQAEKCYRKWGTEKKANQMKDIIRRIS